MTAGVVMSDTTTCNKLKQRTANGAVVIDVMTPEDWYGQARS